MSHDLQGKVILISGSTGIAARTAILAAREGAAVFIVSRTESSCRELSVEISGEGGKCGYRAMDLTEAQSAEKAVEAAVRTFGRLDALYNVAGISGRKFGDGPVHECAEDGWDTTLDTNAKSMFFMCGAVIRQMLRQEPAPDGQRGCILNMASVLGFSPSPRFFSTHAYAASKGAIIGMTKSMAASYALKKIRINAIAPGLIRTPMSARAQENAEILDLMKTKQPLAEDLIEADDVASASLFLLGSQSRMITGEILTVDGGWCVSG